VTNITFIFETSPNKEGKKYREKKGGHSILRPSRLKKWWWHVPCVPHQIASMVPHIYIVVLHALPVRGQSHN